VKTVTDARLRDEAARFALRFTCEECVHFDLPRALCGNGYPPGPRDGSLARDASELAFCKEYELA
jgi:hypothetical protein